MATTAPAGNSPEAAARRCTLQPAGTEGNASDHTTGRLSGYPAGQRQPEGVQGGRGVQDSGAERADPDGDEAVVAGQAIALPDAPQLPVVAAGAPRARVGDVDHAEGGRVLEQDAKRVPS